MSIDSRVSSAQIQKAVKSLVAYAEKKKKATEDEGKTLFTDEDENVWLVITTKTMSPQLSLKPQRVPLVHPIVDPRTSPICLITKDPQRTYKDLLAKNGINFISRVVDISKLKGKWAPFEARRQLAGDYGLFLADERVIPLLPKLLGKVFFKKKKQPIPVNLLKKDLKSELESAISSTYLHQNAGTCTSIKVAHTGMTVSKAIANIEKAIPGAVLKLHLVNKKRRKDDKETMNKRKDQSEEEKRQEREEAWENIQSLGIKTHSSVCLPIWSCSLEDRWTTPAVASTSTGITSTKSSSITVQIEVDGDEGDDTMSEGDEEDRKLAEKLRKSSLSSKPGSEKSKSKSEKVKEDSLEGKRKKRKAEDDGVDASVPVKKSKVSNTTSPSSLVEKTKAKVEKTKTTSTEKVKEDKKHKDKESTTLSKAKSSDTVSKSKTQESVSSTKAKSDTKAVEGNKKLERSKAADFMDVEESASSDPKASKKDKEKVEKEKKKEKKDKSSDSAKSDGLSVSKTKLTVSTTPASDPSTTKTLKSAMKKPDSNLTVSELKEKKTKRASFSVAEKKKEKLTKGVMSGKSGKSGIGGKSKTALVGRGPKM